MSSQDTLKSESIPTEEIIVTEDPQSISEDEKVVRLDSGLVAWSQVLVSHLMVVNGFGYFSSFGLFESHWTTYLDRPASDISWVGSLSLFLLLFLGTLSGLIMDRGHFRSLVLFGGGFQLLGVFTTASVSQYWQLVLSQGLVQGIGNGLLFTPCIAIVATYFIKRRAFALSFAASGAPVGGIIFPIIARQLAPRIGYPWTIRVMGFVMLFNTAAILLLARPRIFKKTRGPLVDPKAFLEPTYLLFTIGIFFTLWGIFIAYFYTITFGKTVIHLSQSSSLTLLIVLNAAGVPGRLVPAFFADAYFGAFNLLIPFAFGTSIMLFGWIGISSSGSFYVFVVLYGLCANAVQTLYPSALSQLTTDLSKMGSRTGMVLTIASFACLTGAPIAGTLIGKGNGSYLGAQLFAGTAVLLGTGFLAVARWTQLR
ncbi:MFS monocarboxylate transporter-like protein [Stipitochalara longipes BDJ]|nr:MFS monocarboxylate transporter-like protein [Stipitochalara longipes BDJ]